ncbi:nuclear transport factor 2 family protein [Streptomyces ferrugineus]|uniref:Nuclear transport factor 2 family protein n=1 Tax=Streptomyces ferrugineus TaxID=1413221 RepID=A0A7M2SAT6_9ACTN|nr:nuclear transport factor 2 family protein [Streptomyces ferrugineus]QOV33139.1 nuclear transport factor 2 family protein [Streptomyces ferrugineus]
MTDKLEDTVRQTADRMAITELIYRYAHGHNHNDAEAMNSCFTEDAVFVMDGGEPRRVSELGLGTPQAPATLRKATGLDHIDTATTSMTNVSVDLQDDTATVESMALTTLAGQRDGMPAIRCRGIRLHDDVVRRDGEWKLARRSHDLLWAFEPTPAAAGE